VVLIIGTGIAGGLILGGHPYTGGGFAGEIGHALSDPQGERCPCGAVGCLETISSAAAIARRYGAASGKAVPGALEVLTAATAGDADAIRVWEDAVRALAEQLARLAAVLAPEAIVLGGGLAQAGSALFDPLAAQLEALLSFHRRPVLLRARLGDDAGLLGTALAARDLAATPAARSGR
jgi:glucokinase